jgi:CRISPR-associated protein Cas5d
MKPRERSRLYHVMWQGSFASWNPPGFRVERISNILPSHSGLVGLIRQVYGKPQIQWHFTEVRIMKAPRRLITINNELKDFGSRDGEPINAEARRTQRTVVWLRDVTIVTSSFFTMTREADRPDSTVEKHEAIADRRFKKGQFFRQPYFGTSECHADFEEVRLEDLPPPADINVDLGLTYFDTAWNDPDRKEYYAPLRVCQGVALYPSWEEVRELGICRERRSA